jgi:hypothetical protein
MVQTTKFLIVETSLLPIRNPLGPNSRLRILFSNILSLLFSPNVRDALEYMEYINIFLFLPFLLHDVLQLDLIECFSLLIHTFLPYFPFCTHSIQLLIFIT